MNIYSKLQKMRVDLQSMSLKKTGENKFAGYKYYELGDILPSINKLMLDNSVAGIVSFGADKAVLRLVNCEKPEETIEFESPMATVSLKGAHDIQNLGAVETYQRRYLYMTAFEVVESDYFDATQGKEGADQRRESKQKTKKMSEDMSAKLNKAIRDYGEMTGKSNKEIMTSIINEVGKRPDTMDDEDGQRVMNLIQGWGNEYLDELGA